MTESVLPRLLEPEALQSLLPLPADCLLVQLAQREHYRIAHLPGAALLEPSSLLAGTAPVPGALADIEQLRQVFSSLGLNDSTHIIACDDEGGGWAGRLIWTLEVVGHHKWSFLNGCSIAWRELGLPLQSGEPPVPTPSDWNGSIAAEAPIAGKDEIIDRLEDPDLQLWDARSPAEYSGARSGSRRAGHIPGAVNCEWTRLMDSANSYRLKSATELQRELDDAGIRRGCEVITYCQSHHRSAFTFLVGTLLGLKIRGYAGSWSEWGNSDDTPIELS